MRFSLPAAAVLTVLAVPPSVALGKDATTTTSVATSSTATAVVPTTTATTATTTATTAATPTTTQAAPATTSTTPATTTDAAPATDTTTDDGELSHPEDADARAEAAKAAKAAKQRAKERAAAKRRAAEKRAAAKKAREKAAKAKKAKAKAAKARKAEAAKAKAEKEAAAAAGSTADDATATAATTADAVLDSPATALSGLSVAQFRIPPFLLPIYQAAGTQYGVRWEVLAAINEVETDYGRNLNVSTAGAEGWMQFMPATWTTYGTDGNGDGKADPYNPVDAIFAAARYLEAAGAGTDIRGAVFSYNHADWYVDDVLKRAKAIAALPSDVVGSLTGLTMAQLPVYAEDVAVDDAGATDWAPVTAAADSAAVAVQDGTITRMGTSPTLGRYVELQDAYGNRYTYAHLGALAEQHLVAKKRTKADDEATGDDAEGDAASKDGTASKSDAASKDDTASKDDAAADPTATADEAGTAAAASDGSTAIDTSATAGDALTVPGGGTATTSDPAPTSAATAGSQDGDAAKAPAASTTTTATAATPATTPSTATTPATTTTPTPATPAVSSPSSVADSFTAAWSWSTTSLAQALGLPARTAAPAAATTATPQPAAEQADDTPDGPLSQWVVRSPGLQRSDVRLATLRKGSHVTAGTVLGRTGTTRLRFAIRPAGAGTPRIDPRPIVAGWERLDDASVFGSTDSRLTTVADATKAAASTDGTDVGRLLLMSKAQLQQRVLADRDLTIYAGGRSDISTGQIDRRVLATLEFLTANGLKLTISCLKSGHSLMTTSGNVSAHSYGDAVDIAAVNGTPILGHQGAGSITESTIRLLLRLQGTAKPNQIISLMTFDGADNTLSMADHADHIHVGFAKAAGDGDATLGKQVSAALKPSEWPELAERLGKITNPSVRTKVSDAATEPAKDDDGK